MSAVCAPCLVPRPQNAVGERVAHRPPAEVVAVVRTGVFIAFFGERQGSDLEARVGGGQGLGPIDIGSTMLLHLVPPARFPVLIGADAVVLEMLLPDHSSSLWALSASNSSKTSWLNPKCA